MKDFPSMKLSVPENLIALLSQAQLNRRDPLKRIISTITDTNNVKLTK